MTSDEKWLGDQERADRFGRFMVKIGLPLTLLFFSGMIWLGSKIWHFRVLF